MLGSYLLESRRSYKPIKENDLDSELEFMIGLKSNFSIDTMIYYGEKYGLFIDSSYRHKNEDRAPLFFVGTRDDNKRFFPGTFDVAGSSREF